jgi:translocator protein
MDYKKLILCVGVCLLAGVIGSFFTMDAIPTWYAALTKPSFNPPNWVFGPVWTTLYILMGISLYLVWISKKKTDERRQGIIFFFVQLGLNTLWSILFFGLQSPFFAFIEIVILWFMILLTMISFYKVRKIAAYLLVPYILWVSFASILNLSIYFLNG